MNDKIERAFERMDQFFDSRADSYDDHMLQEKYHYEYYQMIARPIQKTEQKISILDLGCGSGLELMEVFKKVPNALITGIDLSQKLMNKLMETYRQYADQITLIKGSYLTTPFSDNKFDYVISSMTMHHLVFEEKVNIYQKINQVLKNGGLYIEGDYVTNQEKEKQFLRKYRQIMSSLGKEKTSLYHLDIPFSIETQKQLLFRAGFKDVKVFWCREKAAIFVAK